MIVLDMDMLVKDRSLLSIIKFLSKCDVRLLYIDKLLNTYPSLGFS